MPIFEYVCKKCSHRFERFIQGKQKPKCPECASGKLERQIESFVQGRSSARRRQRGLNSADAISHFRALVGNIPTIPNHVTNPTNPGRRSRRSTVA